MSSGQLPRHRSRSSASKHSSAPHHTPPPIALTPDNDAELAPCAATASFFLYSQRNQVLVLHHDTLAIERRFDLHHEDVLWIAVDNTSERGMGRLAVSYDKGNTAIVWDILTGGEVARFSAYEKMLVASFMRNGNIAFGKHYLVRTVHIRTHFCANDLRPSNCNSAVSRLQDVCHWVSIIPGPKDCSMLIQSSYMNGSILVATLQPSFTILHTLTTTRAPSKITGLAWHGSSSKQKTDMLATQTSDGDLRVWSVPKLQHSEVPNIIRVLQRAEHQQPGPCWFAWSKSGRIVQHCEGETRSWDVRTKKVTYDVIPTVPDVISIAVYGPTATLFTLGRNHTVQQYDITPTSTPMQVASVQHVPANTPPTPPTVLEEMKNPYAMSQTAMGASLYDTESSADEGTGMSPLQKIAREMDSLDALESELRDKVGPLSPVSSRASSVSSRSSGASSRRKGRKYLYDRPDSSRASSTTGFEGTEFSFGGPPSRPNHESMSIRSVSSYQSRPYQRSSNLRNQTLPAAQAEQEEALTADLFAYTKARLREVSFRTPHYGTSARTPELLQREMLSVVFGWNDDIHSLIRDELSRHQPGSASAVLLAKWLGDMAADDMASMIGSQTMTSSDWMLLALSSIGVDSQKKVGEAFVQRLLEKGDIHPAVAILLGLGENNDAIEVYVSQQYWMEAVLLTCLTCPSDWGRHSWLIRKWGEAAVQQGQAELAVRCFSCTSVETSEPWFSPRAQDAVYTAQQARLTDPSSPPLSPPSRSGSGRMTAKNASLKLITTFGAPSSENPISLNAVAATPIAESAISPGGLQPWKGNSKVRALRDPSSARTATPGGYARRKRLPSRSDIERAKLEAAEMATPLTAAREVPLSNKLHRRTESEASIPEPQTAVRPSLAPPAKMDDHLPSPAQGVFTRLREQSRARDAPRDRKPDGLAVQVMNTRYTDSTSPGPSTGASGSLYSVGMASSRAGDPSPPLTGTGVKGRAIDAYISSVDEARNLRRAERAASRQRGESRRRNESRAGRASSRMRESSQSRHNDDVRYIQPAKRSPSSPVPMSAQEYVPANRIAVADPATTDDENFYKLASPVDSHKSLRSTKSEMKKPRKPASPERAASRARSRGARGSADDLPSRSDRGRSKSRKGGSEAQSPTSPLPYQRDMQAPTEQQEARHEETRVRFRARSSSRVAADGLQARRAASRARSSSRRPSIPTNDIEAAMPSMPKDSVLDDAAVESMSQLRPRNLSKKDIAAKELEARRQSLARRPSAPTIPMPGELSASFRPNMSPRSQTDLGNSPTSFQPPMSRSHTVDPESMSRHHKSNNMNLPAIGLPATPRAMRHPRYMSADPNDADRAPPVPEIPGNFSELSSLSSGPAGSNLSQITGSNLSQAPSSLESVANNAETADDLGPLLPSTVFGQKPSQAPPRSASAPPEKNRGGTPVHPAYNAGIPGSVRRQSGSRGHVRKISPPEVQNVPATSTAGINSIDQALRYGDQQAIVIPEESEEPAMILPELQHLAGPPIPPPPPTMFSNGGSGVINIAIDENAPDSVIDVLPQSTYSQGFPYPMERATTASPPVAHRRGHGSVSESIGSRFRGVTDRMRSSSRGGVASRAKSPPMPSEILRGASPYESVLPLLPSTHYQPSHEVMTRAKSPYEQDQAAQQNMIPPPPPPPPAPPAHGADGRIQETTIPPTNLPRSQSAMGGYRNPKEIRANMPPTTLQQGVYNAGGFL
nr:hypothetical protein CFP56_11907 [Quercus suber]